MKLLPVASQLKLCHPQLYQHLYCPACSDDRVETVVHLLTCSAYCSLWEQLFHALNLNLQTFLLKTFADHTNRDAHVDIILRTILGTSSFSDSFLDIKTYGIEMKLRSSLIKKLVDSDLCSHSTATKIATIVLWEFVKLFKTIIWRSRCDRMIQWEHTANITTMDKRSKPRHSRNNQRSHVIYHDSSYDSDDPICYDDPPIVSGIPVNNPRPPGITRTTRLASALMQVNCQIKALIQHNAKNAWIFKSKDCFNKTVISL